MPDKTLEGLEFHILTARMEDARHEVDARWTTLAEPMRAYLAARDKQEALRREFVRRMTEENRAA